LILLLRALLEGRIVFTSRHELLGVDFFGRGKYGRLFAGLITRLALASPAGDDGEWKEIDAWLSA
jgi:hypothetical protein